MRLVTYSATPGGLPRLGVRVGHRVLDVEAASRVEGEPLPASMKALLREGRGAMSRVQALAKAAQSNAGRYAGAMYEERAISFLPPVPDAGRFIRAANARAGQPVAARKPNSDFVGHNTAMALPDGGAHLDCRAELVYVIGRTAQGVSADDDAFDWIAGVTLLAELEARAGDAPAGLAMLGPEVVTLDEIGDPDEVWVTCAVNGRERARTSAREQAAKLPGILAHFSAAAAIEPGDLVSSAAAEGEPLPLRPGDVVECAIEGVTTLRATIVAAQ